MNGGRPSTPYPARRVRQFGPDETREFDAAVLEAVEHDPDVSTSAIARLLKTNRTRVRAALNRVGRRTTTRQDLAAGNRKASNLPPDQRLPKTPGKTEGEEKAFLQAKSEADKLTSDAVADEAVRLAAFDIEAGRSVRERWEKSGLQAEFATPLLMDENAWTFWWEHRDALTEDDRIIESLRAENEALRAQLTPHLRRQKAEEAVFQSILAASIAGNPLDAQSIEELRKTAERWAGAS